MEHKNYIYVRLIIECNTLEVAEKETLPILVHFEKHGNIKYIEKVPYWKFENTYSVVFLLLDAPKVKEVYENALLALGNYWHYIQKDRNDDIRETIWNRNSDNCELNQFFYNSKIKWCNFELTCDD